MTLDDLIGEFLEELASHTAQSPAQRAILRRLLWRVATIAEDDSDALGLATAASALDELLKATAVFAPYLDWPKLTIFGSARTSPESPLYDMARELGATMAARGWMLISGAGPGIMQASSQGAGRDHTLGVNIDLPFEQDSNPYVDADSKLVDMKYFFTRKVAMTRASRAFVVFPGGLGTMDELFEMLTLLHTGKTSPAPLVLVDTPEGSFWDHWRRFMEEVVIADHYVGAGDMELVAYCRSVGEVVEEIDRFYENYVSFEAEGGRGHLVLRQCPTSEQLERLGELFPVFARGHGFTVSDDDELTFDFDGREYVNLRRLIDEVNRWVD